MSRPKRVVGLRPETVAALNRKAKTCVFCARILKSLSRDGELQAWPPGASEDRIEIPVDSMRGHLNVELGRLCDCGSCSAKKGVVG